MKPTKEIPFACESIANKDGFELVCHDPDGGQSIIFMEVEGKQAIRYSFQESDVAQEIMLTDLEAKEINAWRNSGRRNSYWNWPGWSTVRIRSKLNQ